MKKNTNSLNRLELHSQDFSGWHHNLSKAYNTYICYCFTPNKVVYFKMGGKLIELKIPENVSVDDCCAGTMPIYDVNSRKYSVSNKNRFIEKKDHICKFNAFAPHHMYNMSNDKFVKMVYRQIYKYKDDPEFGAVVSVGSKYVNFDEVFMSAIVTHS